jgi:hypothetical protein
MVTEIILGILFLYCLALQLTSKSQMPLFGSASCYQKACLKLPLTNSSRAA